MHAIKTSHKQEAADSRKRLRQIPEIELLAVGGKRFAIERKQAGKIVKITIKGLD